MFNAFKMYISKLHSAVKNTTCSTQKRNKLRFTYKKEKFIKHEKFLYVIYTIIIIFTLFHFINYFIHILNLTINKMPEIKMKTDSKTIIRNEIW